MIRVLLAEDHRIVREGLKAMLCGDPHMHVVGEAEHGQEAVEQVAALRPDVVVMDLSMPRLNGVDATARIRREHKDVQVVVLSMHADAAHVAPALKAGALGYLVKGAGLADLREAIVAVASRRRFLGQGVEAALAFDGDQNRLTTREREVLQLVGEGLSSPAIAERLGLSVKTIERHRGNLMQKLDAENVAGLVRAAVRLGLVQP